MILNPKPKPIRYRVSSGGVEHASLDSLRSHFCWCDVKELIQLERIQEWLRKIDRGDIAESIDHAREGNASDWSIAALFFGLDGSSVDGWLSLAKYWYNQRLEATIDLNLDEWANSNLKYEQLKSQLPPALLKKMGEYQYNSVAGLSPQKQKKELERLAAMGSSMAKQRLTELKEEAIREAKRKKQEAEKKAKQLSIQGLRNDWEEGEVSDTKNYDSYLHPVVTFLLGIQKLSSVTSGNIINTDSLADCIAKLECEAINSPNKEYYWCVILATYRHVWFSTADKVVNSIRNKEPEGVTAALEETRDYNAIIPQSAYFLKNNPRLQAKLLLWNHASSNEIHKYEYYKDFLREIGDYLLNNTSPAKV